MDLRAFVPGLPLPMAVCWPPLDSVCPGGLGFRLTLLVIARFAICLPATRAAWIPYRSTITLIATPAGAAMSNHPSHFIDTHAASANSHDNDANADSAQ